MALVFKDSGEAQKVAAGRKKSGRPTYYSADHRNEIEISEDFEAVLILVPAAAREQARVKLTTQTASVERQQQRDTVLKAALQKDFDNAAAQQQELESVVTANQEFKDQFAQYASVGEVGLLLRDAQIDTDEQLLAAERAKHRQVCVSVLLERISSGGVTEDIGRERESWSNVLTEYTGV